MMIASYMHVPFDMQVVAVECATDTRRGASAGTPMQEMGSFRQPDHSEELAIERVRRGSGARPHVELRQDVGDVAIDGSLAQR
jgi:hypothetical protein